MKPRELEKELLDAGWQRLRGKGSHRAYVNPEGNRTIIIPWHEGKDVRPGTAHNIRKKAGLIQDKDNYK